MNMEEAEEKQERTRNTARLIMPLEAALRALPKDQIEEIVIWLKAIHNPPIAEDRSWDVVGPFYNRIEELRNLPEQIDLQVKASRKGLWAIACGAGMGTLATLGIVIGYMSDYWLVAALLIVPIWLLYKRALKLARASILVSKEQEQRHLWRSIREATSVPELQHAGLYAFLHTAPSPTQKQMDAEFDAVTQKMRDAIYRNGSEGRLADEMEWVQLA